MQLSRFDASNFFSGNPEAALWGRQKKDTDEQSKTPRDHSWIVIIERNYEILRLE